MSTVIIVAAFWVVVIGLGAIAHRIQRNPLSLVPVIHGTADRVATLRWRWSKWPQRFLEWYVTSKDLDKLPRRTW